MAQISTPLNPATPIDKMSSAAFTFVEHREHMGDPTSRVAHQLKADLGMLSSSPTSPKNDSEPLTSSPSQYLPFTESQVATLTSIVDAAYPSITDPAVISDILSSVPSDAEEWQKASVKKFVQSSYSEFEDSLENLIKAYVRQLSPVAVAKTQQALDILGTAAGTAFLTNGKAGWLSGKTMKDLSPKEREEVLRDWKISPLAMKRELFKAFVVFPIAVLFGTNETVLDAIGYPAPERRKLYKTLDGPKFRYSFVEPDSLFSGNSAASKSSEPQITQYETDVLIIGSGAGGGVVSKVLTDAGHKCLIIEKGLYVPTGEKTRSQIEAFVDMYQYGGFFTSEDSSVSILAASVFGGGTAINWSASFRTPHHVRQEWADKYGLEYFLTDKFSESIDAVCERMGVSNKHLQHNHPNRALIRGCEKLGYHFGDIPQNTGGHEHACGFCSFGCECNRLNSCLVGSTDVRSACLFYGEMTGPYGEKQGTVETWMVDAAKNGAQFMKEIHIDRLLFGSERADVQKLSADNLDDFGYSATRNVCVGALGTFLDGRKIILKANKGVVVSGGTVNSPTILTRSKIPNPNIGKNLHLHPCGFVTGYFPDKMKAWDGAIMTAVSDSCANRDGSGYGAKLETIMSFPMNYASSEEVWTSAVEHKSSVLRYNHSCSLIVLTRDRDSGQVVTDKEGKPRVNYSTSKYDQESMLLGMMTGAEILLAAGATRVRTSQAAVPAYEVPEDHHGVADPRWRNWIAEVKAAGVKPGWANMGAAHQMGTCRMGTSPSNSVIDPRGRVWDTQGLWVADASAFPTASGVNPMVTTMSISHSIARFIDEDLSGRQPNI